MKKWFNGLGNLVSSRKRRRQTTLLGVPFLLVLLLMTPTSAVIRQSTSVNSYGTILYQPTATNLAPFPTNWYTTYDDGPQIIFWPDNNVLHNGHPSVRLEAHVPGVDVNTWREINSYWFAVSPGDHIVYRVWAKTSAYSGSHGATLGWDWYGANGRIGAIDEFQDTPARFVSWGSDWTQLTIEKIVPSLVEDPDHVNPTQTPTGIILWMGANPQTNPTGTAWFADTELYINP